MCSFMVITVKRDHRSSHPRPNSTSAPLQQDEGRDNVGVSGLVTGRGSFTNYLYLRRRVFKQRTPNRVTVNLFT